jgi:hypothetical protein
MERQLASLLFGSMPSGRYTVANAPKVLQKRTKSGQIEPLSGVAPSRCYIAENAPQESGEKDYKSGGKSSKNRQVSSD